MDVNDPYAFLGQFSPETKLNVIYDADKPLFLQTYITGFGVEDISHAIKAIPGVTAISVNSWIVNAANNGLLPLSRPDIIPKGKRYILIKIIQLM